VVGGGARRAGPVRCGDDKAAEVFAAVAHRVHEKYCPVGRALRGGETIQMLPVSPPAAEA
jgi:hypothetical protein